MIVANGSLALPREAAPIRLSLRVREGRVSEIAPSLAPSPGEETVDASGLLVLPGAIDPHVHFDEPGFTEREDFLHGSAEAARGGVTTVIDMPCTSLPPVIDLPALEGKLEAVSKSALVDFGLYGGVSGHAIEASLAGAMAGLAPKVLGFKCYFVSGMKTFTRVTHFDFERALAEAERLGRPLLLHAEDLDYVDSATRFVRARRGAGAPEWADYADSRPEAAELVAAASALALARGRAGSLHVVHVGTAAAAQAISAAGASCETCAHYLAFGREDFADLGPSLKTAPVVKGRSERDALWRLLADGTIGFVASDHAPAGRAEKETGDPWTAYGGIPGVGTGLPYLLSEGYLARRLTLGRFLEAIAAAAAGRYGLAARKGSLDPGKDADFVLVDPRLDTVVRGDGLLSKGRITPFDGMRLRGRILATYVRGRKVFDSAAAAEGRGRPGLPGIVAEPGYGKFLTWGCS